MISLIIIAGFGLCAAIVAALLAMRGRRLQSEREVLVLENANLKNQIIESEKLKNLELEHEIQKSSTSLKEEIDALNIANAKLKQETQSDKERIEELKNQILQIEERHKENKIELEKAFKLLSAKTIEEQSDKFKESQKETLTPLKEELERIKKLINEDAEKRSKTQGEINNELQNLIKNTNDMKSTANNLATALKGDNKKQGDWGEVQLANLLEANGIMQGMGYEMQNSIKEDGVNKRPDCTIYLPDNRAIIADSKVSLTAWEQYCTAMNENDPNAEAALKAHIKSITNHINELSGKYDYLLKEKNMLDFTLMFMPIDEALNTATRYDNKILEYAYRKNIIIVNQLTLLPVLKIVQNMWMVHNKDKNQENIFNEISGLLKKFESFIKKYDKLKDSIDSINKASKELDTTIDGRGGIIPRRDKINDLFKTIGQNNDPIEAKIIDEIE